MGRPCKCCKCDIPPPVIICTTENDKVTITWSISGATFAQFTPTNISGYTDGTINEIELNEDGSASGTFIGIDTPFNVSFLASNSCGSTTSGCGCGSEDYACQIWYDNPCEGKCELGTCCSDPNILDFHWQVWKVNGGRLQENEVEVAINGSPAAGELITSPFFFHNYMEGAFSVSRCSLEDFYILTLLGQQCTEFRDGTCGISFECPTNITPINVGTIAADATEKENTLIIDIDITTSELNDSATGQNIANNGDVFTNTVIWKLSNLSSISGTYLFPYYCCSPFGSVESRSIIDHYENIGTHIYERWEEFYKNGILQWESYNKFIYKVGLYRGILYQKYVSSSGYVHYVFTPENNIDYNKVCTTNCNYDPTLTPERQAEQPKYLCLGGPPGEENTQAWNDCYGGNITSELSFGCHNILLYLYADSPPFNDNIGTLIQRYECL